jgi:cytochrome bd-type quinol oxidase subunit 2
MLVWLIVLAIIAGEIGAVYLWRQRQFPRPRWLFNRWALAIYAALLLVAWLIGVGLSALLAGLDPGIAAAQNPLLILAIVTGLALLIIVAYTFFIGWVLRGDIRDIPK